MRLDVSKFFTDIPHDILLSEIPVAHEALCGKPMPKTLMREWDAEIAAFLQRIPSGKGIPVGHPLSHILAGLLLLRLDLALKQPFLRVVDDYLIFCRSQKEAQQVYEHTMLPALAARGLTVNTAKVEMGRFGGDGVHFIGFHFKAGYVGVDADKQKAFTDKITHLTSLRRQQELPALIKDLNKKIRGFGHYYKHGDVHSTFAKLDGHIRKRLRRYLARKRNLENATVLNTTLTAKDVERLGLASLVDIKTKHDKTKKLKKGTKTPKKMKATSTTKHPQNNPPHARLPAVGVHDSRLRAIELALAQQTKILRGIEKRLAALEKK